MKYLKLLLIVGLVTGLIYGALRIMGPTSGTTKIDPESPYLLEDLKKKVDRDWENANEWNQQVYDKNISDANAYHNELDKASAGSFNTLVDYTNEKVCNKLIEFLNNEFSKSNCSQAKISQIKSNIDYFIKENETITASDSRFSTAYSKIALYNNILGFGRKQFGLSPGFNKHTGNWNDFSAYRESQLKIRDNYKNNIYYSTLSHITDVKNSLASVDNKLAEARNRFEINLSNEIISAYSYVPRTAENKKQLNNVFNHYYESYTDDRRLSNFYRQFKKEVDEEQSRGNLR